MRSTRRVGIGFVLAVILIAGAAPLLAQSPLMDVARLAADWSHRATTAGLPGGGSMGAAEQGVAQAVASEVQAFDASVAEVEASSRTASLWLREAEEAASAFDRSAASRPGGSAEAAGAAIVEFQQEWEMLRRMAPSDPAVKLVVDEVDWWLREAQRPPDPAAERISAALERYFRDLQRETGGSLSRDLRAKVGRTLLEAVAAAIDRSGVQHKHIARRRVRRLIQIMVPSQMLPMNGYWRAGRAAVSESDCGEDPGGVGDGGGALGGTPTPDPGRPLCAYDEPWPYLVWEGKASFYLPGSSSIYGREASGYWDVRRGEGGRSVGSVRRTFTQDLEVLSPIRIRLFTYDGVQGGCTRTTERYLDLVRPDDSICPRGKTIDIEEGAAPTPEPTLPPGSKAVFRAGLPLFNDESACRGANAVPTLDEVRVMLDSDTTAVLSLPDREHALVRTGETSFEYDSGNGEGGARELVDLTARPDGSGSLTWSRQAGGKTCVAQWELFTPGSPAEASATTTAEARDAVAQREAATPAPVVAEYLRAGRYGVTWTPVPNPACPADKAASFPSFTEATIGGGEGAWALGAGGESYPLQFIQGQYVHMNAEGQAFTSLYISGQSGQTFEGGFTSMDGTSVCVAKMALAPR